MPEFSEYTPGTPCWIDLQTSDIESCATFYRSLFGWDRQDLGPEAGGYGFFLKDGKMVAGVMRRMDEQAPIAWTNYVCVNDADATAARASQNGGTTFVEPMDVMTAGRMAVFADPIGAVIGLWQPGDHKGAQLANETAAWSWSECVTRDVDRAKSFYTGVFGWKATPFEGMDYTVFENDGRGIGGCMAMPEAMPKEAPSFWLTYFSVADADAAAAKARDLGGNVAGQPTDIPNVGRFAVVTDPQGATFGVFQTTGQPG